ncbi:hypothetical protein HPB48_007980 [Haemaphysalis longicornis]|uniref:TRAF1-6 MATH domain-containing protein n=1 Tax=Haemaphysalis longicornis TaxID=44386 RepID=A0A9J6FAB3_HAELO|nr:hypothetical protein HPB48_007980 [Haemaphysalis longicornis]
MAPGDTHAVFGFDCGLDWRPTVFVNGISPNRVCSACGLVPSSIALLPCRHVLCQPCHDRCQGRCCLGGEDIVRDDVVWSTFAAESILGRKIQCWNAAKGCNVSGLASEVLDHFYKECQHHTVPCPRCRQTVFHKDIVNHIRSGSCTQAAVTESVSSETVASGVAQVIDALGSLDARVASLQASFQEDLRRVEGSFERALQHSSVLESVHSLDNTLKEGMQLGMLAVAVSSEAVAELRNNMRAVVASLRGVTDRVSNLKASQDRMCEVQATEGSLIRDVKSRVDALSTRLAAEREESAEKLKTLEGMVQERMNIKPASEENLERYHKEVIGKLSCLEAILKGPVCNELNSANALEWTIEQLSEFKKKGDAQAWAKNPSYFYGYYILPGAQLETKPAGIQSLHVCFKICQGKHDHQLAWPIKKKLFLWFVHPTDKLIMESVYTDTALQDLKKYQRPSQAESGKLVSIKGVQVKFLEERGFVTDNKLIAKIQQLPFQWVSQARRTEVVNRCEAEEIFPNARSSGIDVAFAQREVLGLGCIHLFTLPSPKNCGLVCLS